MPKFINTHGGIILPRQIDKDGKGTGKQRVLGIGDEIELSVEERNHLDPTGLTLVTPEVFAEMKKSAEAHRAFEDAAKKDADNPKAKATIPTKTLKALADLKGATTATPAPKGAK